MDYDHRWDASSGARKLAGLLPKPIASAVKDVALRVTQAVEMRSLFRADSAPDRSGGGAPPG